MRTIVALGLALIFCAGMVSAEGVPALSSDSDQPDTWIIAADAILDGPGWDAMFRWWEYGIGHWFMEHCGYI